MPAVERAARILDALASARQPRTLAELARELDLPRSSLHGLLATLVALDLARRVDAHFTIGPRSLRWADAYGARMCCGHSKRRLLKRMRWPPRP